MRSGMTGRRLPAATLVLLALTAIAVFICVWIEVLNAASGSYLPRDFADGHTWREVRMTDDAVWREVHSYNEPAMLTRPLTATEDAQMKREVRQGRAKNDMYLVVTTAGLLQYPLVLLLALTLPLAYVRQRYRGWRVAVGVAFGCAIGCGILMFYRGYFTSLGF